MITKEQIEERKAGLIADYHALSGAIQDCDYWISQLEEGSNEDPSSASNANIADEQSEL